MALIFAAKNKIRKVWILPDETVMKKSTIFKYSKAIKFAQ